MAPELMTKIRDIVLKYGVPAACFFGGYVAGDFMGIKNFVTGIIPTGVNFSPKVVGVIVSAVLLAVGVAVWSVWEYVGPAIGASLAGVGVNLLIGALRGA